jgi:dienelactone hydrolase
MHAKETPSWISLFRRGKRWAILGAALLAFGILVIVGPGSIMSRRQSQGAPSPLEPSSPGPELTRPSRSSATPASLRPNDRFAVGEAEVRFARRVVPSTGNSIRRPLPITVWYPAVGSTSSRPVIGAAAARSAPFPLVVFAHGFGLYPRAYLSIIATWTHAGYVVAAPVFPHTNPGAEGGLDESDIVNQPADVRFVVKRLLGSDGDRTAELRSLIDEDHIAVAGHSDGGSTVLSLAYNKCCREERIDAVIVMAGEELALQPGDHAPGSPPLLAIQGTADEVNRLGATRAFYSKARSDKYLLLLRGADHLTPYTGRGRSASIVQEVSTAFLDRYLQSRPRERVRLAVSARESRIATLRRHVS